MEVRWPPPREGHTDDLLVRLRSALAERYALQRQLGEGGSAVVFLAQDLRHSRPVAIKVLRPELAAIMGAERFLHEIETVARLQHPHILPLYDSGEASGLLYFVMPYVSGESLRDLLEREQKLGIEQAIAITNDVASALAYAHGEGVIHRDIKPENILLFGGKAVVADFGIARAIRVAGAGRITDANRVPGTPLYMSPEQSAGRDDLDGRSDVYSLAIVLYEMLGGEAPFTGISPIDVMVHQIKDPPRPLSELRKSLPSALTVAIGKALAKNPADRHASVTEFADAVRNAVSGPPPRRLPQWIVAASAAAAVAIVFAVNRLMSDNALDSGRYVVLPFAETGGAASEGLRGDQVAMLLRDALSRWTDLRVVGSVLVSDALKGTGDAPLSREAALTAARSLRAGRMVWGSVSPAGDSVRVSVGLYEPRRNGRLLVERVVTLARDGSDLASKVGGLADSLVADRVQMRFGAAPVGTASHAAWNRYATGHSALMRWQLDAADSAFAGAAALDPAFALAHFWLAQVRAWRGRPVQEWVGPARTAVAMASRLGTSRDSAYAYGLLALAEGRYQEACRRYDGRLRRDTTDIVALMGFGDCHYRDRAVVGARTPSGWAVRGSVAAAPRAYSSALQLAPAFNLVFGSEAYARLANMFFVETNRSRFGTALPPDTGLFAGFPSLSADTVAFVVDRRRIAYSTARPPTIGAAINVNRRQLFTVTEQWMRALPNRPEPHETRALLLELTGQLGTAAAAPGTAIGEIARARRLATDSLAALTYATTHLRLLLKAFAIAEARALADSILARPELGAEGAEYLAGVAALVGKAARSATLSGQADSLNVLYQRFSPQSRISPEIIVAVRRFHAFAGFGGPRDSLVSLASRVEGMLFRYLNPRDAESAWHFYSDDALTVLLPDPPVPAARMPAAGNPLLEVGALLRRGDREGARRRFDSDKARFASDPPGEIAMSAVLPSAHLLLAMGDSTEARRLLAATLENLAVAPTLLIDEPLQAATLVRGMALLAELSAQSGDTAQASRFATMVVTLWSDCDIEYRPLVERMRALQDPTPGRR